MEDEEVSPWFTNNLLLYISKFIENKQSWGRFARTCKILAQNARKLKPEKLKQFRCGLYGLSRGKIITKFNEDLSNGLQVLSDVHGSFEPYYHFIMNITSISKSFIIDKCSQFLYNLESISDHQLIEYGYISDMSDVIVKIRSGVVEKDQEIVILLLSRFLLEHGYEIPDVWSNIRRSMTRSNMEYLSTFLSRLVKLCDVYVFLGES